MIPQIPAISRPPTAASAARGSESASLLTSSERSMIPTLRSRVSSSIPVPRPATSRTPHGRRAANSAEEGVVLPIPISPVPIRVAPSPAASRARPMPISTARRASSGDMAGPKAMFAVPGRTFRGISPSRFPRGAATPMSTTRTSAPAQRARTLTAAPPATMLRTIWPVTSPG